ncbi:MAG: membrane protein insertase YidC [Butyrivibrio sp.]|nr:membrane protein insertase YidC [Butyrivibrio sp.]
MTFSQIIYTIILGPLELLFDTVYAIAVGATHNPGLSLIFLSLTINLLVLPLYRRADAMQEEERQISIKLKPGIDQIRKAFKGDERFMILQTYYRQNDYKPYYALKGSLSLLLEIPFFIAAYHYLSHSYVLQGASFGPIADLGAPDNLIKLGGISLHLLPILMTLINIVSGAIYTKGMTLKSKIQLYGMALVFLVLLYESPAGLVFYWTLNNLFSLVKNIFYKLPNPMKVIKMFCSVLGIAILIPSFMYFTGVRRKAIAVIVAVLLQLPLLHNRIKLFKNNADEKKSDITEGTAKTIFYACCVFMAVLVGLLIPSAIVSTSTAEFVELSAFKSPIAYIVRTAALAVGVFLVWCVIFYRLASDKSQKKFSLAFSIIMTCAVVEYMFFGKRYGNISPLLRYDVDIEIAPKEYLINMLVLAAVAGIVYLIWKKGKHELVKAVCIIGCLAITAMSVINIVKINTTSKELEQMALQQEEKKQDNAPEFTLSKSGKNVVVLLIDRAISGFVPYMLAERPELQEQFAGFTYYPNTFSFGLCTNVGAPPIYGGYDYTPIEIQNRSDESLKDKHNEALMVMPKIFMDNNYKVTVCDPPYANYQWNSDLSLFDQYEGMKACATMGYFDEEEQSRIERKEKTINRNLFCYSVFRIMPVFLHKEVYDGGNYNYADYYSDRYQKEEIGYYITEDEYKSTGMKDDFLRSYEVLKNMPSITKISDSDDNTFMSLYNLTTHEIMFMQEPEYEPSNVVDNTEYEKEHAVRTAPGEKDLKLTTIEQKEHYQTDMAAFIQLGKWFDYLRENGVWDNTRIIIVADHGYGINLLDVIMDDTDGVNADNEDTTAVNPLLMIKDFGSTEYSVSDTFMTNADVPAEALKGIIDNPVNPFTGNPIDESGKDADELRCLLTDEDINKNNGNTFTDPVWITLKNKYMFDPDNWTYGY